MKVVRLSWAGIEIQTQTHRLLIDPLQNTAPLRELLGDPLWPPIAVTPWDGERPLDAFITHRHPDHYDFALLRESLGPEGRVFCPASIAPELKAAGLNAHGVTVWETVRLAPSSGVAVTAVPAVDWRGDDQVSWVVEENSHRIFHGGDTIWHGSWWQIVQRFTGFDAAFLPVNGVIAHLSGMEPSNLPATLTPHQAAVAARLLKARRFCPIHFGQFRNNATYREHPRIDHALREAAAQESVHLRITADGEEIALDR